MTTYKFEKVIFTLRFCERSVSAAILFADKQFQFFENRIHSNNKLEHLLSDCKTLYEIVHFH